MRAKSGIFLVLSALLLSSAGFFTAEQAFAQNDTNKDSSDKNEKQERDAKKAEEKRKDLEEKKAEDDKRSGEKKEERKSENGNSDEKRQEEKQDLEEKRKELEEKRQELEEKREELESDREKMEEKLRERTQQYEEKLKAIKEKYHEKIDDLSSKSFELSIKSENIEELSERSEKIQERLEEKLDELDTRTQKILEQISDGEYMGEKIGSLETIDKYELVFDSVSAYAVSNKSSTSYMTGQMTFTTFDSSKSNLKLELESCLISVDDIPYVCGFGKARTVSSGDSGAKDSLVIIAFLEDNLAEEVHSTLKIFLDSEIPIRQIEESTVSILGPQSKLSHLRFLDGNATLSKITPDDTSDDIDDTSEEDLDGNHFSITLEDGITTDDNP
ncbi:MAG: hypothetical protein K5785_07180 [Nitrosarchaeum sp.]|nr:hypothetical protein [Nitrosarchaeum sp.]